MVSVDYTLKNYLDDEMDAKQHRDTLIAAQDKYNRQISKWTKRTLLSLGSIFVMLFLGVWPALIAIAVTIFSFMMLINQYDPVKYAEYTKDLRHAEERYRRDFLRTHNYAENKFL